MGFRDLRARSRVLLCVPFCVLKKKIMFNGTKMVKGSLWYVHIVTIQVSSISSETFIHLMAATRNLLLLSAWTQNLQNSEATQTVMSDENRSPHSLPGDCAYWGFILHLPDLPGRAILGTYSEVLPSPYPSLSVWRYELTYTGLYQQQRVSRRVDVPWRSCIASMGNERGQEVK